MKLEDVKHKIDDFVDNLTEVDIENFSVFYDPSDVGFGKTVKLILLENLYMLKEGKIVYLYTRNPKGRDCGGVKYAQIIYANEFSYAEYEFRFNVQDEFLLEFQITFDDYESNNFEIIKRDTMYRLGNLYISIKKAELEEYIKEQKLSECVM